MTRMLRKGKSLLDDKEIKKFMDSFEGRDNSPKIQAKVNKLKKTIDEGGSDELIKMLKKGKK